MVTLIKLAWTVLCLFVLIDVQNVASPRGEVKDNV